MRRAEPAFPFIYEGKHNPRGGGTLLGAGPERSSKLGKAGVPPALENRAELAQGAPGKPQEPAGGQKIEPRIDEHQRQVRFAHLMDQGIQNRLVPPPHQCPQHLQIARAGHFAPAFPARYPALRHAQRLRDVGLVEPCRDPVSPQRQANIGITTQHCP